MVLLKKFFHLYFDIVLISWAYSENSLIFRSMMGYFLEPVEESYFEASFFDKSILYLYYLLSIQ